MNEALKWIGGTSVVAAVLLGSPRNNRSTSRAISDRVAVQPRRAKITMTVSTSTKKSGEPG